MMACSYLQQLRFFSIFDSFKKLTKEKNSKALLMMKKYLH